MNIKARNLLSNKDKRQLVTTLIEEYGEKADSFFGKSDKLERVKTEEAEFITNESEIWFFYFEDKIIPSIHSLRKSNFPMKKVTVDTGAIKFILNGADIMAPGVVFFEKNIQKQDFVVITEERADAILGVGRALVNSETFEAKKKGKVVQNIHCLKDDIWSFKL